MYIQINSCYNLYIKGRNFFKHINTSTTENVFKKYDNGGIFVTSIRSSATRNK